MIGHIDRLGMRACSLVGAALFALTLAVPATLPKAPPTTPSVEAIVADYVTARGGLAKIRAIKTLRQTGRIFEGQGREALVVREVKPPGRIRVQFTIQGATAVFASNGTTGWKVSPFEDDMALKELPDEVTHEAIEQADLEGPLVDWKAKGHTVEFAGNETVSGRATYKLKVTLKSGAVRYSYIDAASHFEVRVDSTRQVKGRDLKIETTFADHKKTGGVLFPRRIEIAAEGRPQHARVVVDKVEVNPTLSDALFERPSPAKH
jgi:outer membrane lipoprotein-sorting protein